MSFGLRTGLRRQIMRYRRMQWQLRQGLSGTFTATVESDSGPFIPKPATVTFTVK